MPEKIDFSPAIIAGVESLAKAVSATLKKRQDVNDAFTAYSKRLAKIDDDLRAEDPISVEDAADRVDIAKSVLKGTIASATGLAQAKIAKAVNDAALAFFEVAKVALSNGFPG
jgi:hypothetical protein